MRQENDPIAGSALPSLSELLARYVAEQTDRLQAGGLGVEAGSDIDLHDAAAAQAQVADPRLAWEEATAALQLGPKGQLPKPKSVPDWSGLVAAQEPALDLAFCAGNFPQMVRNLTLLLQDEAKGVSASSARPFQSLALGRWAEEAMSQPFPQPLLAIGLLRLSRDFEQAGKLLKAHASSVPAEWQAAWRNEEAALAWQQGRREQATALWAKGDDVPALFNRGMAALFQGKAAEAWTPLRQAVARLPENSSWHHLGQLYLTLAEMRR